MLVYRISHKKYTDHLYAPGISGRWNGTGKKVLYCSESISLAFLESMIRRQGAGFNRDYQVVIIDIPDDMVVETVSLDSLTTDWRNFKDYTICQGIGNDWFDSYRTPVLKVPSAIIIQSFNFVINAQYADYSRIKVVGVTELMPDPRIDELLKKHGG